MLLVSALCISALALIDPTWGIKITDAGTPQQVRIEYALLEVCVYFVHSMSSGRPLFSRLSPVLCVVLVFFKVVCGGIAANYVHQRDHGEGSTLANPQNSWPNGCSEHFGRAGLPSM